MSGGGLHTYDSITDPLTDRDGVAVVVLYCVVLCCFFVFPSNIKAIKMQGLVYTAVHLPLSPHTADTPLNLSLWIIYNFAKLANIRSILF